jgi:glutathione S-transferase
MYRLLGRVRSRAQRTLWLLEELGVGYEYVSTNPRSPEAFALNPLGKVPILETPEGVILDSLAQMHYLADKHGGFTHPAGSFERARQDAFSFAVLEMMDANLWAMALHGFGLPEEMRLESYGDTGRQMVTHFSTSIAGLMEGEYAVGDSPTVADILLAHSSAWARGLKIELDPKIHDHMRRMRARPAMERVMALEEPPA